MTRWAWRILVTASLLLLAGTLAARARAQWATPSLSRLRPVGPPGDAGTTCWTVTAFGDAVGLFREELRFRYTRPKDEAILREHLQRHLGFQPEPGRRHFFARDVRDAGPPFGGIPQWGFGWRAFELRPAGPPDYRIEIGGR